MTLGFDVVGLILVLVQYVFLVVLVFSAGQWHGRKKGRREGVRAVTRGRVSRLSDVGMLQRPPNLTHEEQARWLSEIRDAYEGMAEASWEVRGLERFPCQMGCDRTAISWWCTECEMERIADDVPAFGR